MSNLHKNTLQVLKHLKRTTTSDSLSDLSVSNKIKKIEKKLKSLISDEDVKNWYENYAFNDSIIKDKNNKDYKRILESDYFVECYDDQLEMVFYKLHQEKYPDQKWDDKKSLVINIYGDMFVQFNTSIINGKSFTFYSINSQECNFQVLNDWLNKFVFNVEFNKNRDNLLTISEFIYGMKNIFDEKKDEDKVA